MNEATIRLHVMSSEGDTLKELLPSEALDEIKDQVEKHGKWFYDQDMNYLEIDELSEEDLLPENDYYLSNLLKGGDTSRGPGGKFIATESESEDENENVDENIPVEDKDPVPESCPYRTKFTVLSEETTDAIDSSITIDIDSNEKKLDVKMDPYASILCINRRDDICDVLEETLNNMALQEVKILQEKLNSGCPVKIISDSHKLYGVMELVKDLDNDIQLYVEPNENSLLIDIKTSSRFKVMNRREYIVHYLRTELAGLGMDYINKIREAVNV